MAEFAPDGTCWCGVTKCQQLEVPTQSSVALTCSNRVQDESSGEQELSHKPLPRRRVPAEQRASAAWRSERGRRASPRAMNSLTSATQAPLEEAEARRSVHGKMSRPAPCQERTPRGGNRVFLLVCRCEAVVLTSVKIHNCRMQLCCIATVTLRRPCVSNVAAHLLKFSVKLRAALTRAEPPLITLSYWLV